MAEQDRPTPKTKLAKISGADKKPIPSKGVKGVPIKAIKKDKTWDRLMKKRKNPDENYDDFKGGVINDFIQWMLGEETRDKINKRKQIEAKRLAAEKDLLTQYMNPEKWTGKFLVGNPEQTFRDIYNDIQSAYSVAINDLNEQHHMYQDDQEFDEDNPKNYVLQEWYALFEKAYRTAGTEDVPNSIYEGVFDTKKLVRLKQEFWASTLPNGERMIDYKDFVARNTTTTIHPPRVMQILGNEAQLRATQETQQAFLKDSGKWNDVLDKSK